MRTSAESCSRSGAVDAASAAGLFGSCKPSPCAERTTAPNSWNEGTPASAARPSAQAMPASPNTSSRNPQELLTVLICQSSPSSWPDQFCPSCRTGQMLSPGSTRRATTAGPLPHATAVERAPAASLSMNGRKVLQRGPSSDLASHMHTRENPFALLPPSSSSSADARCQELCAVTPDPLPADTDWQLKRPMRVLHRWRRPAPVRRGRAITKLLARPSLRCCILGATPAQAPRGRRHGGGGGTASITGEPAAGTGRHMKARPPKLSSDS
mmetsp:Transcript_80872/g.249524  ORF Transcript_80872/g.249524 Transcript_80872/m.249524 type:complete len:269 (+) Transcript_80872:146-952(+)